MDQNAEMVIMRHRALFAKPGQLKEMVKLPLKRNQRVNAAVIGLEAMLEIPFEQIRGIVSVLHESITSNMGAATSDAYFR